MGIAVVLAVGATVFAVQVGGDKERVAGDVGYWSKRLVLCQKPGITDTEQYMDESFDCLYDAMRDSIWNNSYQQFNDALRPLTASDVMLEYVCHIPGHDLGREIMEHYDNDYRRAVLELASNLCGSGIIHGIYDVFGETQRGEDEWRMMGEACVEANQRTFNACGDAVGHAAYESTGRDLTKAMLICDLMSSAWVQYTCANGAYMQANFPQSTKLKKIATPERRIDPNYWPPFIQFCDRQVFKNPSVMEGCYGGAGWVMGNTIYGINAGYLTDKRARGGQVDENRADPQQEMLILQRATDAVQVCMMGTHPDGSQLNCVGDMLSRMPIFFYRSGVEKLVQYCTQVTAGHPEMFLDKCIGSAQQHVTPQDMTELVRLRPGALEFVRLSNPQLASTIASELGMQLDEAPSRGTGGTADPAEGSQSQG